MTNRFVLVLITAVAYLSLGATQVYTFKCGQCAKIEQYADSGTKYCYGTKEKSHSKSMMRRLEDVPPTAQKYQCPECKRVDTYEGSETRYCSGTKEKPHEKAVMRRLEK